VAFPPSGALGIFPPSLRELAFTPNGTTLATGDSNGTTYLWRVSPRQVPEATYG
jgi:WD40 repeat protein